MNLRHLQVDSNHPHWISLWVDVQNRSLNVMSSEVFQELDQVTRDWVLTNNTKPVVVRSAKAKGNVVGADIKEIIAVESDSQIQAFLQRGQDIYQAWENLPFPTIAWIRGACLGGGLEWAMACHFRFACNDAETVLGMPECKLGLIPGWGGTQRLPRWVGIAEGWRMLASGDSVSSQKALEIGLVDGLWDPGREEDCLSDALQRIIARSGERSIQPAPPGSSLQQWREIMAVPTPIDLSSPHVPPMTLRSQETIARAITVGLERGFAEGCRCERESFYGLLSQSDVQQGLQRFASRRPANSP